MIVEKPIAFGRAGTLIGVLCGPASHETSPASRPTAVFINAGIIHRVGPNRLYVNLARELARRGVRSLRFDLGGIGDSSTVHGEHGSTDEVVYRDLADAIDLASRDNPEGVVLVGLCSGADNALRVAEADTRVKGAVLLDPNIYRTRGFWMRHYLGALRSARTWKLLLTGRHPVSGRITRASRRRGAEPEVSPFLAPTSLPPRPEMAARCESIVARGCELFFCFTGGLPTRYNHEKQLFGALPGLRGRREVRLRYFEDWDHTFSSPVAQQRLRDEIVDWLELA